MKNLYYSLVGMLAAVTMSVGASDEKLDDYRAVRRARMKTIAERFEVHAVVEAKSVVAELVTKPVLGYTDSTRKLDESTLWLWTERKRPVALLAVELYPEARNGPSWLFEIVSLADTKIGVSRDDDWTWGAEKPGIVWLPVAGEMIPSENPALQLTQARKILQRCAAHENAAVGGRIELRALTAPLYRYEDEESGVIFGAIFAFANGTNPEVLLLVEARKSSAAKPAQWYYGFAQMTGAHVYASFDNQEVWSQKEADPPAIRDSYVNGWLKDEELGTK